MFLNKQIGNDNLDLTIEKDLDYYLNLTKDYSHNYDFIIKEYSNGFNIIDDGEFEYGSKAKMADFFISQIKEDTLVYVAPRTGYAPYSLTYLAKKYNKKLILFMPASKEVSEHQLKVIELGATPIFLKIPAMPTLNIWAKDFAEKIGAKYLPFGLKHELVVAGGVRIFHDNLKTLPIKTLWSVISTGVLSRTLQIALQDTEFNGVAVARNIQQGELGRAKFYSYDKPFLKESKFDCPVDSIRTYDVKAYEMMIKHGKPGDWFFNVAKNMPKANIKPSDIDSQRSWGDKKDLDKYL